jgi:GT2 family glycosyltransferase
MDFLDNTDDEWMLSIHNDVVVAPETLLRLLSWDKPLVSALVFMRVGPALPHIWKSHEESRGRMVMRINDTREWFYKHKEYIRMGSFVMEPRPDDALAPIDFTSTSCTLIHRSVLETMRPLVNDQWFLWDDDYNGGGEDRRFFTEALRAGFPAFVDRSCVAGHLTGNVPVSSMDFIAWDSCSTFEGTGE